MTDPQPEVLTTTTSATPIADSIPAPATGPVATQVVDWTPDVAALQAAKGDVHVWAHEFSELVGHTTGSWIDESTFVDWLGLFSQQVAKVCYRSALFQVANTATPPDAAGDPALALLAFRDQMVQSFRSGAGL